MIIGLEALIILLLCVNIWQSLRYNRALREYLRLMTAFTDSLRKRTEEKVN